MRRITRTWLATLAKQAGLFITFNNPGDNPTWKVSNVEVDYFALSDSQTLGRFHSGREVVAFLDGYVEGRASRR